VAATPPVHSAGSTRRRSSRVRTLLAGTAAAVAAFSALMTMLTNFASLGVDVALTEVDVTNASTSQYAGLTQACINVARCIGDHRLGVRDSDSWRSSENPLPTPSPLPARGQAVGRPGIDQGVPLARAALGRSQDGGVLEAEKGSA
jgi:hypothetical protein